MTLLDSIKEEWSTRRISGRALFLIAVITSLVGAGILWTLEDPYVKSQYYETDATVTIPLQWPDGADSCGVHYKLVSNRLFTFVFKHKPSRRDWDWGYLVSRTGWLSGKLVNSTKVSVYNIKRPATLIVWVRYYGDIVEEYNGVELEMSVVLGTVRYEYSITPMSKSFEVGEG